MSTKTRIANLKRIQSIFDKLDNQTLVRQELDELVHLTAELHEKAVILRYKAAEERVFGNGDVVKKSEAKKEEEPKTVVLPDIKEIDFSIFEREEPEDKNETEVKVEPESKVEPEVQEEAVAEPEVEKMEAKDSHDWPKRFEKVLKDHESGLQTPLAAIAGSFGLNERILYINELFDGEAEKFSACVQKLDSISEWSNCVVALTNYANAENWEIDNDTTDEFILHVKRKYA
ncbi:MAG: hypothetical protein QNL60_02080 [Flavobacteriales bacterium]|jgi:hypothetical protein